MAAQEFPLSLVIKAIDKATAPLREVNKRIHEATAPVRKLNNAFRALSAEAGLPKLMNAARNMRDSMAGVGSAAATVAARVGAIGAVGAFGFQRLFIQPADDAERLALSLEAIEGSSEKAKASLAFLQDLTVKTPFQMTELSQAFRILRGFGMEAKGGPLQAIADQVAKLGGSGEDLSGVALQLGQAFSKGRLQADDANILVERGIPVWGLLQRAVERVTHGQKLSVAQLRKMSEAGQLGTKAVKLLLEQMGIESKGASAKMMGTWTGMISNLADRWNIFVKDLMSAGPMTELKANLGDWLTKLDAMAKSGELKRLAEAWGGKIAAGFKEMRDGLPKFVEDLKGLAATAERVVDKLGGLGTTLKAVSAIVVGGPLISAVGGLSKALWGLGAAVLPMFARAAGLVAPVLAPLGSTLAAMAAAAAGLAAVLWQTSVHWKELKELFSDPMKPGGLFGTLLEAAKDPFESLNPVATFRTAWKSWKRDAGFTDAPTGAQPALVAGQAMAPRPTIGAATAMAAQASAGGMVRPAHIKLEIERLHKGERARVESPGGTKLDLSLGYSMMPSH